MNMKTEFLRIMAEQTEMALATSVNNIPNVRIVNFYFDPCDNILYFSTFKDNNKVKEIEEKSFDCLYHYSSHWKPACQSQRSRKKKFENYI